MDQSPKEGGNLMGEIVQPQLVEEIFRQFDAIVNVNHQQSEALHRANVVIDKLKTDNDRMALELARRPRVSANDRPLAQLLVFATITGGWPAALMAYLEHHVFDGVAFVFMLGTLGWLAGIGVAANLWIINGARKK